MGESSSEQVNDRAIVIQRAGELSEFVQVLESLAVPVAIHDGPSMPTPDEVAGAAVVVVSGGRLLEGRTPNLSLWPRTLAVVDNASKTMMAHLNRVGAALVIRRPIHPRTLRLLLLHEIYRGPERRRRKRTLIGHPVRVGAGLFKQRATLLELSDTGARIELAKAPKVGGKLLILVGRDLTLGKPLKLQAKVVRCIRPSGDKGRQESEIGVALVDPRKNAKAVAALLDRFAAGPASWSGRVETSLEDEPVEAPVETAAEAPLEEIDPEDSARRLPPPRVSAPVAEPEAVEPRTEEPIAAAPEPIDEADGTDDDLAAADTATDAIAPATENVGRESAPATHATDDSEVVATPDVEPASQPADGDDGFSIDIDVAEDAFEDEVSSALGRIGSPDDEATAAAADEDEAEVDDDDRRRDPRIPYDRRVVALGEEAARVLVGRDLSQGGMKIASTDTVAVGDTLRVALHCGTELEPLVVLATALRDDGEAGIVLTFQELSDGQRDHLEKIIASSSPIQAGPDDDLNALSGSVVMGEMLETISRAAQAEDEAVDSDDDIDAHLDSIFDTDESV